MASTPRRPTKKAAPRKRASSATMHVVGPGDAPPPAAKKKAPMTVMQALASGDKVAVLEAEVHILARRLDDPTTPARDLAALSRRFNDTLALIAAAKTERGDDGDDVGDAVTVEDETFDGTGV